VGSVEDFVESPDAEISTQRDFIPYHYLLVAVPGTPTPVSIFCEMRNEKRV
jgi:hypothetical protein